jgi:hypothetical protein
MYVGFYTPRTSFSFLHTIGPLHGQYLLLAVILLENCDVEYVMSRKRNKLARKMHHARN